MTAGTAINFALPAAVFVLMFVLGLGLAANDFRRVLRNPKALLLGLRTQIALVPVLAVLLVTMAQHEATIALGIVILALCPGGAFSNVLTRLAGGDVALSVSLSAVTNLVSVATVPVLSVLAARYFLGFDVAAMDIREMTLRVAMIATLPVMLGMLARYLMPVAVACCEPIAFKVVFTIFLMIVFWATIGSIHELRDGMFVLGFQLAGLTMLLLGLGFALGRLFGLPLTQCVALAIEASVQNSGLGLAVGSMLWGDPSSFPLYATPSAVYGVLTYVLTFPLITVLSRAWR